MTLTLAETGAILTHAQQVDQRHWDEGTAQAWASMIDPLVTFQDAWDAVTDHYTRTRQWIMPSDINDFVKTKQALRKERIQAVGAPEFPNGLTYAQEQDYRRTFHRLVGDGMSREDAHTEVDRRFGAAREIAPVPQPDEVRQAIQKFRRRSELNRDPEAEAS